MRTEDATYSEVELREALRAIDSTSSKCRKALSGFQAGTSQHTLLVRRLKALEIASALIRKELESPADVLRG